MKRTNRTPTSTGNVKGSLDIAGLAKVLKTLGVERPVLRMGCDLSGRRLGIAMQLAAVADLVVTEEGEPMFVLLSVERYAELVARSERRG